MKKSLLTIMLGVSLPCLSQTGFVTYQPTNIQEYMPDNSILERSLKQVENRANAANEALSQLEILLSKYEAKLNNDQETLNWYNGYKKELIKNVSEMISNGDYGGARRLAVANIGKVASNSELNARVRTSEEYLEIKRMILSRTDVDYEFKERWIKDNPYKFVPILSDTGEVIGGKLGIFNAE